LQSTSAHRGTKWTREPTQSNGATLAREVAPVRYRDVRTHETLESVQQYMREGQRKSRTLQRSPQAGEAAAAERFSTSNLCSRRTDAAHERGGARTTSQPHNRCAPQSHIPRIPNRTHTRHQTAVHPDQKASTIIARHG